MENARTLRSGYERLRGPKKGGLANCFLLAKILSVTHMGMCKHQRHVQMYGSSWWKHMDRYGECKKAASGFHGIQQQFLGTRSAQHVWHQFISNDMDTGQSHGTLVTKKDGHCCVSVHPMQCDVEWILIHPRWWFARAWGWGCKHRWVYRPRFLGPKSLVVSCCHICWRWGRSLHHLFC